MAVEFSLSDDQQAIADVFTGFFSNESDIGVVREAEPLGYSAGLWSKLVAMDAPGMAAPGGLGGAGASLGDLVVVAEAVGSHLAPVPLIEHWVASLLCPAAPLLAGHELATIALRPADAGGIWRLVPAGAVADIVVGIDGDEVVATRSPPPGQAPANHASAPLADRSSRTGDREVLGDASLFGNALDVWRTLTAAALVGIGARSLEIGLDYVLEREQFGRLIGSFQSIQHGLADLPALIDGARFLAHKAAWANDQGLIGSAGFVDIDEGIVTAFAPLASMAFIQAADAAAVSSDRCLHYHGGYGFSVEYDIQLYFRRARGWAIILGDLSLERLRLADLLVGGGC